MSGNDGEKINCAKSRLQAVLGLCGVLLPSYGLDLGLSSGVDAR